MDLFTLLSGTPQTINGQSFIIGNPDANEREIALNQAIQSGKPEHIAQKIVDGKMDKYERYLMLKIGNLLRLDHDQLISAKLKVMNSA